MMRFAYADPPYLGLAKFYDHPEAALYDTIEAHRALITRLVTEYPDGWALSMHTGSIHALTPYLPAAVRWGAWIKTNHFMKRGVIPSYCWEPIVWCGGRPAKERPQPWDAVRDYIRESSPSNVGVYGAKSIRLMQWILDLLGFNTVTDTIDELFPGTAPMQMAARQYRLFDAPTP